MRSRSMPAGRKGPRRLLLALASVAAALVAGELGLRVSGFDPYAGLDELPAGAGRTSVLRLSDDDTLVYELVPLARARAWRTDVAINSGGFRDREFEPGRNAGVLRIVALGDSITFGNGLALADTWPKQLERLLVDGGRRSEVLNLGVGGYDTLQEAVLLDRLGLRYEPDVVVVCFCVNDVGLFSINADQLRRLERSNPLRELRLVQLLTRSAERPGERLADLANEEGRYRSDNAGRIADLGGDEVLAVLMRDLQELLERHGPLPPAEARDQRFLPLYASPAHVGRLRLGLARLAALRAEHGFDLVLLFVPHLAPAPLEDAWALAQRIVRHEVERLGITFLPVIEEFAAEGFARLNHDNGPVHPNARGHAILAARVRDYLAE